MERKMAALNHTIVNARSKEESAEFVSRIIGLQVLPQWARFLPVQTSNGVTLDFADAKDFRTQHYAFILTDYEFDLAFERLKESGAPYYAHFDKSGAGKINHLWGGRGVYFNEPSGHFLEMITRPYGDYQDVVDDMKKGP
jgi:catechol-2,3-dioxygenase